MEAFATIILALGILALIVGAVVVIGNEPDRNNEEWRKW